MSLTFLSRLATEQLPYRTRDQVEVLHVEVLAQAKLIDAELLQGIVVGQQAVVHSITTDGRNLIEQIVKTEA